MTWTEHHRRAAAVRALVGQADLSRRAPLADLLAEVAEEHPGVLADETEALLDVQRLWFQYLSGALDEDERLTLAEDRADHVVSAWTRAAQRAPGARVLLDRALDEPGLARALRNEARYLGLAAGRDRAVEVGEGLRAQAIDATDLPPSPEGRGRGLFTRLRAAMAA